MNNSITKRSRNTGDMIQVRQSSYARMMLSYTLIICSNDAVVHPKFWYQSVEFTTEASSPAGGRSIKQKAKA
jgi:hypothetical protein